LIGAALVVVITTVVAGLMAIGPPGLQRERRLDQRRVKDLSALSRQVEIHWNRNRQLPADLGALAKLPGFRMPIDPDTGAFYDYIVTGTGTYRLCAVFALDTSTQPMDNSYSQEWLHGAGPACFDRHVEGNSDKD
jgi:hypothetical protein